MGDEIPRLRGVEFDPVVAAGGADLKTPDSAAALPARARRLADRREQHAGEHREKRDPGKKALAETVHRALWRSTERGLKKGTENSGRILAAILPPRLDSSQKAGAASLSSAFACAGSRLAKISGRCSVASVRWVNR